MTIISNVTPAQYQRIQSSLALDKLNAKKKAMRWYIDNLLIQHFQKGNTLKYGYKPNKAAYNEWKRKHGGGNIQLVLSGELRDAVMMSARVNNSATLTVNVPQYGIYQMELGRDFLKPDSKDMKLINKMYRKFLMEIRLKTVATIQKRY